MNKQSIRRLQRIEKAVDAMLAEGHAGLSLEQLEQRRAKLKVWQQTITQCMRNEMRVIITHTGTVYETSDKR